MWPMNVADSLRESDLLAERADHIQAAKNSEVARIVPDRLPFSAAATARGASGKRSIRFRVAVPLV
jgi:hypothetical protein